VYIYKFEILVLSAGKSNCNSRNLELSSILESEYDIRDVGFSSESHENVSNIAFITVLQCRCHAIEET